MCGRIRYNEVVGKIMSYWRHENVTMMVYDGVFSLNWEKDQNMHWFLI